MKATYKDDEKKGPGYGFVTFSEDLFPAPPWKISLQRASDKKFLTKQGHWAGESVFIPLDGKLNEDGSLLELYLEPPIVDSLDTQQQYRINLAGADGISLRAPFRPLSITFSQMEGLDNTARAKIEEQVPQKPQASDPEKKNNESDQAAEVKAATPELKPSSPPPAPEEKSPEPLTMEESTTARGGKAKIWLPILLAMLIIGAALAWLIPKFMTNESDQTAKQSSPQTQVESAEAQVKKFFSQASPSPQAALALAEKLPKTNSADQDALYRLYYFAVEKNAAQAFLPYANCLNPAMPTWGTIRKNAPDAMKAYEEALKSNPEAAQKAIEELMAWLNKEAAAGNTEAATWLEQIKK